MKAALLTESKTRHRTMSERRIGSVLLATKCLEITEPLTRSRHTFSRS